eukprot:936478-Rhodomonas_salina.1
MPPALLRFHLFQLGNQPGSPKWGFTACWVPPGTGVWVPKEPPVLVPERGFVRVLNGGLGWNWAGFDRGAEVGAAKQRDPAAAGGGEGEGEGGQGAAEG